MQQLGRNCAEFGIPLYGLGSERQGIVHVIGPELGLTQPGMTIVCGDSHTATHGAFGALAFGIGTSEVEMVLATQSLLQRRPRTYEVRVDGRLRPGVTCQGHHPRPHRPHRRRRRHGPRLRVHRRGHPRALDGGAHDRLQHVDRGRRPGRPDRARTTPPSSTSAGARTRPAARPGMPRSRAGGRCPATPTRRTTHVVTLAAGDLEPMITYGTNPGMGMPHHGARAGSRLARRTGPPARPGPGAELHGPGAGPGAPWPAGRRRLHRLVHQQPHQRPAPGGRRPARPTRRGRPAGPGRARLASR